MLKGRVYFRIYMNEHNFILFEYCVAVSTVLLSMYIYDLDYNTFDGVCSRVDLILCMRWLLFYLQLYYFFTNVILYFKEDILY